MSIDVLQLVRLWFWALGILAVRLVYRGCDSVWSIDHLVPSSTWILNLPLVYSTLDQRMSASCTDPTAAPRTKCLYTVQPPPPPSLTVLPAQVQEPRQLS